MATLPLTHPAAAIPRLLHRRPIRRLPLRPVSATARALPSPPPPPPPGKAYQPFRPPPSPLPAKYRSLDPLERLAIIRDRLGLWHEYAPLLSSLAADGFPPPSIEEVTGISGVEQNSLAVAAQVRDSLLSSSPSFDPALLAYFDSAGAAELLYELRLLSVSQRAAAASRLAALRLDPRDAQELARAIKDFPRRRAVDGWDRFSAAAPGDCLAFSHFRLSREALSPADRAAALELAMAAAETDEAKKAIAEEMERAAGKDVHTEYKAEKVSVPVVRLRYGEVAEASSVEVLPVCAVEEGVAALAAAPGWCRAEGELGVVAAERAWGRWAVLPRWGSIAGLGERGGVAVEFRDARVLPWRRDRFGKEAVLVVADRGSTAVTGEEGLYLVAEESGGGGLGLERGAKLLEKGMEEALAAVVMVVRSPREEGYDQLGDEDWE